MESPSLFCGGCQPLGRQVSIHVPQVGSWLGWLFFTFGLGLGEEEILLLGGGGDTTARRQQPFFAASILDFFTV